MYFKANISRRIKVISLLFFLFILFDAACLTYFLINHKAESKGIPYLFLTIILGSLLTIIATQVSGYNITPQKLEICRRWWKQSWSLDNILEALPEKFPFNGSIRVFGIGGVLGFYGKFRHRDGRYFSAYVTDEEKCIMLRTNQGWIAISPCKVESFLSEMKNLSTNVLK